MMKKRRFIRFFLLVCLCIAALSISSRLVGKSHEKASRRSEYAVIDQIRAKKTDLGDSDLVRQFEEERIRDIHKHFHDLPELEPEVDRAHQSQCLMCHSLLPHSKNVKTRVMLNMHSDFLNCETCHYQKNKESVRYMWFDMGIENEITRGRKFGTQYNEETGMLEGTENHISKITPFLGAPPDGKILFMSQREPLAKDFINVRDELTPGQRDQAKKKFHGDIESKGWACRDCHREQGVLDLSSLGFSERRKGEIENLEIVGMYDKYEVFHLPQW